MKPLCSLSLDLDNAWAYLRTHGDPSWQSYPSYLDIAVPRALAMLDELDLCITFFIVGKDAALDENRGPMAALGASRHEIGSHSFLHEQWLHLYTAEQIDRELGLAEEHIERATGRRPDGFRGPGYSLSADTLRVLIQRGYRFDASTFPTFIGPLARAYYFMTATLSATEKRERALLFGGLRDGTRPLQPYLWDIDGKTLLEIPVTTFPVLRVPIHASYFLYLSAFSESLARAYYAAALKSCRVAGVEPSILLHPLDFLSGPEAPGLEFFPGMNIPIETKLARTRRYLEMLAHAFEVLPVGRYATHASERGSLRLVAPRFEVPHRARSPIR